MPRSARIIVPDIPHHIIQRGNRTQPVFFSDYDRSRYLAILRNKIKEYNVEIWAYCLMDNHVHFVAVPHDEKALANAFGQAHKLYTRMINLREGWRGYLWQGRFVSFPMDEKYLFATVRYIECNPVRAGLVKKAEDYSWSSARVHVYRTTDPILSESFLDDRIADWSEYLKEEYRDMENGIRQNMRSKRPLGSRDFIRSIEEKFEKRINKKRVGT